MSQDRFSPLIRELACCFQSLEHLSGRHIRSLGLTLPQYDILTTLGNNDGMNCGELGERTLITKGTLTGVLDRLEQKGLVQRKESHEDRRSVIVYLTPAGRSLFDQIYHRHLNYLSPAFDSLSDKFIDDLSTQLEKMRAAVQDYGERNPPQKRD